MKITLYFLLLTSWACQPPGKSDATHNPRDHKYEAKGYVLQKYEGEVLNDPRVRKMIIKVIPVLLKCSLEMQRVVRGVSAA